MRIKHSQSLSSLEGEVDEQNRTISNSAKLLQVIEGLLY
jgi:hypothetical protein